VLFWFSLRYYMSLLIYHMCIYRQMMAFYWNVYWKTAELTNYTLT